MILTILFVVTLFIWLLTLLPFAPMQPYAAGSNFLAFIAVLLLGLFLLCLACGEVDILFAAAMQMIVLHRIDGIPLVINPAQITALHPPSGDNRLITKPAQCAVWLTDGKYLAVRETCDQVKAMLEAVR